MAGFYDDKENKEFTETNEPTPFNNDGKQENEGALNWDSVISKESEFIDIPDGIYDFVITDFQQDYFNGSEKMNPCNVAVVTAQVQVNGEDASVRDRLFMHSKAEWKLSQFLICIGQKKPGVPLKPNWNQIIGSTGKLKTKHVKYNGIEYVNVACWLPPIPNYKKGQF